MRAQPSGLGVASSAPLPRVNVKLTEPQIRRLIELITTDPNGEPLQDIETTEALVDGALRAGLCSFAPPDYTGETSIGRDNKADPIFICQCFFCGETFRATACYQLGLSPLERHRVEMSDMLSQLLGHIQARAAGRDPRHEVWNVMESTYLGIAAFSMAARYAVSATCGDFLALYRRSADVAVSPYLGPGSAFRCAQCQAVLMPPDWPRKKPCAICSGDSPLLTQP